VFVLHADGSVAWRRDVTAPVSVALAPDGSRAALINHDAGKLVLLEPGSAEQVVQEVAAGASAAFLDDEFLLVNDRARVFVMNAAGRVVWQRDVGEGVRRRFAIHPREGWIGVATSGADSAVYLFDREPRLLWQAPLLPGGSNQVIFHPDGTSLYVGDVGDRAGVYAFSVHEPAPRWRVFAAGRGLRVAQLAADELGLLVDYVRAGEAAGGGRTVVRLTPAGVPLRKLELPSAEQVVLAGGREGLVLGVAGGENPVLRAYRVEAVLSR
jgi:sugar lactone lactonase YvrE